MPRPRTRLLPALCAALLGSFAAPSLSAQQIDSPYRFITTKQGFNLRTGYGSFGTGTLGVQPGTGPMVGAFYGVDLGGPWAFDLGGMVHLSERDVIDPTKEEGDRVVGTADSRMAEFGVRLRFGLTGDRTFHGINPFLVAGMGVGLDVAGSAPADALVEPGDEFVYGTSFVPTFGAGLRIFPSDRIEARLEVGTQLWVFETPPTFKLGGRFGPDIGDSQTIDFNFISFGLGIRF